MACSLTGADASPALAGEKVTKGMFLIAEPGLPDPNFSETAVLIIHHGPDGTLGVIINRATSTRLSRVLPDLESLQQRSETLYLGGPVLHNALVMLFRSPEPLPSTEPVFRDVYFSQNVEPLADLLKQAGPKRAFRVYAGHAGWAPGQLQGELARGGWRIVRADVESIFENNPDSVWPELIRRSTQQVVQAALPVVWNPGIRLSSR